MTLHPIVVGAIFAGGFYCGMMAMALVSASKDVHPGGESHAVQGREEGR